MDVGFNAHLLSFSQGYRNAGVGRYIYYLLGALARQATGTRVLVYCRERPPADDPLAQSSLHFSASRLPTNRPELRIAYEQLVLPLMLPGSVDLLHAPVNVVPLISTVPSVVTVHDLSFVVVPERFPPAKRRYLTTFTRLSVKVARHVITDSENTRRDVIDHFGVAPERVSAVPLGVDPHFRRPADDALAAFRARFDLPSAYILYLGTLEPRKNLVRLLQAYADAVRRGLDWPLVLAGGKGWMYDDIFRAVEDLGIGDRVRFPGYVAYGDQPSWYSAASLFVYPSLYEGFGLPVLEAMACGTPVLASHGSSLPEAVGDAGLLADCTDRETLGAAITRLASDSALRRDLAARGPVHAASFTWDRTAAATLAAYARALG